VNELIAQLVQQLGINEDQAAGGAGTIFKLVKEHLDASDFSQLSSAVSGIETLIGQAPAAEGAAKLLGSFGSMFGGAASSAATLGTVASAFKSLNLDVGMVAKFAPIILDFVRSKGGGAVADVLQEELAKFVGK
jgi:hypothetical protein